MVGVVRPGGGNHEYRHVSGGADEIDSALALTAMPVHGASKHTDILRRMFIPWSMYAGATEEVTYIPYAALLLDALGEEVYFNFKVPADLITFTSIDIIFLNTISEVTSITFHAHWCADDEPENTGTEVISGGDMPAVVAEDMNVENTGLVLSGLAAGDMLGIQVEYHNDAFYLFGLTFLYTANQ